MHEHPILGAVLFVFGTMLIGVAYLSATPALDALIADHVLALNGALLATLGSRREAPLRLRREAILDRR